MEQSRKEEKEAKYLPTENGAHDGHADTDWSPYLRGTTTEVAIHVRHFGGPILIIDFGTSAILLLRLATIGRR